MIAPMDPHASHGRECPECAASAEHVAAMFGSSLSARARARLADLTVRAEHLERTLHRDYAGSCGTYDVEPRIRGIVEVDHE